MKTILVPVDFSDSAKNAVDYALLLADALNMKLLFLHVFHPSMAEAEVVKNELEIWRKAAISTDKKMESDTIFKENGDFADQIIKLVKRKEVDLVVMGTKGATGLRELFMVSNTARVIEKVSCPVIAVPEDYRFTGLKKIIFATDYHDSDISSIRFIARLARLFSSELIVVHMAEDDRKPKFEENFLKYFMEQVEKSIRYDKMTFQLLEGNDVSESLNQFIIKQKADLFAMSSEDRILIGPFFNRSLTKKFAHHIHIPLFAFHAFDIRENDLF